MLTGSRQLRQGRLDLVQNSPREQVVSIEGEMNVLVEQAIAGNAADRQIALGQRLLRIHETDSGGFLLGGHVANGLVDLRVFAEPQNIQVASRDELFAGFFPSSQRGETSPPSEGEFRETVVDLCGRLVLRNRLLPLLFSFQFDTSQIKRLPFRQIVRRQIGSVLRRERGAVLQVHSHGRKHHSRSGAAGDLADIDEVPAEVVVNRRQARVVGRHRVVHEHLQALPRRVGALARMEPSYRIVEQLPGAR